MAMNDAPGPKEFDENKRKKSKHNEENTLGNLPLSSTTNVPKRKPEDNLNAEEERNGETTNAISNNLNAGDEVSVLICTKCGRQNTPVDLENISKHISPSKSKEDTTAVDGVKFGARITDIVNENNERKEQHDLDENDNKKEDSNKKGSRDRINENKKQKGEEEEKIKQSETMPREINFHFQEEALLKSKREKKEARQKFIEHERMYYLEQRKREMFEAKEAKRRVLQLIEEDKRNRKCLYDYKSAPIENNELLQRSIKGKSSGSIKEPKKIYLKIKLIIRLTNGDKLEQEFDSEDTLSTVKSFIEQNRTDKNHKFSLRTVFPKKVFTAEDYEISLGDLNLAPASVLIVSIIKSQ